VIAQFSIAKDLNALVIDIVLTDVTFVAFHVNLNFSTILP